MKVNEVGGSLRIGIPKPIIEVLNIKKGEWLYLDVKDDYLQARKEVRKQRNT